MEKLADRFVIDPEVRHRKPIIMGTRVPVELVQGFTCRGIKIDAVYRNMD